MTKGDRVRLVRKNANLTLEKFGERLGIKKSAVSQIENGKSNLSDTTAILICREFNVSQEWLINGEGDMQVPSTRNQRYAEVAAKLKIQDDDLKTLLCEYIVNSDSAQLKAALYELVQYLHKNGIDFEL